MTRHGAEDQYKSKHQCRRRRPLPLISPCKLIPSQRANRLPVSNTKRAGITSPLIKGRRRISRWHVRCSITTHIPQFLWLTQLSTVQWIPHIPRVVSNGYISRKTRNARITFVRQREKMSDFIAKFDCTHYFVLFLYFYLTLQLPPVSYPSLRSRFWHHTSHLLPRVLPSTSHY